MAKKGRLSDVEKFYIENNLQLSDEKLGEILDRTPNTVKKVRDMTPEVEPKPEVEKAELAESEKTVITKQEALSKGYNVSDLMGRKREATVMTPAASEMADDANALNRSQSKNHRFASNIHNPKGG